MEYLFWLGHQPHISAAELRAVFSALRLKYTVLKATDSHLLVESDGPIDTAPIMRRLGGTVKIAQSIGLTGTPANTADRGSVQDMLAAAADYLAKNQTGKIQFSYDGPDKKRQGLVIKKMLKNTGRSARLIEIKNTASIIHNNLIERQGDITQFEGRLFVSVSVQDIERFTEHDYGRPQADDRSGMLPPKLARIMLNLSGADFSARLLDPFCGSGTILMEALDMGFTDITGTDASQKAVQDTRHNLDWLIKKQQGQVNNSLSVNVTAADVRNLKPHFNTFFDCIVTEPFMGKPLGGNESQKELRDQAKELEILYTDAFRSFKQILAENGTIIFIIPKLKHRNGWVTLNCFDAIKKIGFTHIPFSKQYPTLLYHRPKQHVGREIFKFRLLP